MAQAVAMKEMYTLGIDFQNKYIAVDTAFSGTGKSEEDKIAFVAKKFYSGRLEACKKIAEFVKEKAGSIVNRSALLKSRDDYFVEIKKERDDAESEYKKHLKDQVVENADKAVEKAHKESNSAKVKYAINFMFKTALAIMCLIALSSGSLAVFTPIIDAVAIFLGSLGGATAIGVCFLVWANASKIKKWWSDKGKKKLWGSELKGKRDKAIETEKKAITEFNNQTVVRKSLDVERKKKAETVKNVQDEFRKHEANAKARDEITKHEKKLKEQLETCENDEDKSEWAKSEGRRLLKHVYSCLEKDYACGQITNANCKEKIKGLTEKYIGEEGWFKPEVVTVPNYDRSAREAICGRGEAETDEEFWDMCNI